MAADLSTLDPVFRSQVEKVIAGCAARGVVIKPYFALRTVEEQARLWRQSRDAKEIRSAIAMLEKEGAVFLADVLTRVGPCNGPAVTKALPGLSWHNWGLAVDCFVSENGKAAWNNTHPGYDVYAEEAEKLGLTAGHRWKMMDSVHIQQPRDGKPNLSWREIDFAMRERWS